MTISARAYRGRRIVWLVMVGTLRVVSAVNSQAQTVTMQAGSIRFTVTPRTQLG